MPLRSAFYTRGAAMSEHDDCNIIGGWLASKVLRLQKENAALRAKVASLRSTQQAQPAIACRLSSGRCANQLRGCDKPYGYCDEQQQAVG